MSAEGLDALRALVAADDEGARNLASLHADSFADAVMRLAAERGLEVTAADIDAARTQAAHAWNLRWIA